MLAPRRMYQTRALAYKAFSFAFLETFVAIESVLQNKLKQVPTKFSLLTHLELSILQKAVFGIVLATKKAEQGQANAALRFL